MTTLATTTSLFIAGFTLALLAESAEARTYSKQLQRACANDYKAIAVNMDSKRRRSALHGSRRAPPRDVIANYRENVRGGYCNATVILRSGEEISGRALTAAIDKIEREIATKLLPPAA